MSSVNLLTRDWSAATEKNIRFNPTDQNNLICNLQRLLLSFTHVTESNGHPARLLSLFLIFANLLTDNLTCSQTAVTNGNLCPNPPSEPWNEQKIPQPFFWSSAPLLPLWHGKCGQPGGEAGRVPDEDQPCSAAGETQASQRPCEERIHPTRVTQLPQHRQVGAAIAIALQFSLSNLTVPYFSDYKAHWKF